MERNIISLLCIGDIVGPAGVALVKRHLPLLRQKYQIDVVVVNGENAAKNGKGITPTIADELFGMDIQVITTGNHAWAQKEILSYFETHPNLIRPLNYPSSCPGKGHALISCNGVLVGVVNVQGRVFMHEHLDCPFRAMDTALSYLQAKTPIIIVDHHAEATAEKESLGKYLDGRVSVVFGTHTHVQTADAQILPQGTAYITDVGAVRSLHSSLGVKSEPILRRFLTQMPTRWDVETEPPYVLSAIHVKIEKSTGKATHIERLYIRDEQKAL